MDPKLTLYIYKSIWVSFFHIEIIEQLSSRSLCESLLLCPRLFKDLSLDVHFFNSLIWMALTVHLVQFTLLLIRRSSTAVLIVVKTQSGHPYCNNLGTKRVGSDDGFVYWRDTQYHSSSTYVSCKCKQRQHIQQQICVRHSCEVMV